MAKHVHMAVMEFKPMSFRSAFQSVKHNFTTAGTSFDTANQKGLATNLFVDLSPFGSMIQCGRTLPFHSICWETAVSRKNSWQPPL